MTMVSTKMSDEEQKEQSGTVLADAPAYPYGLQISLNDDLLDKLGIKSLPAIGAKMMIAGKVEVSSASGYKNGKGDTEQSLTLQITDLEIGEEDVAEEPSKKLYGKK